eukprot:CAMPEP_0170265758 /NCGR_PEP_ID=MMETSP0116_2-20130129/32786_1 /TAXON_ID=400756 /ORGANISM="Durinskia baltica, Strain CSIRO CS-38" /LENGTH=140 /DNA_ID=CAMNT_0010516875 /DNA_START=34 /DNA_END=456 /DNA_ORIENTATION=-
MLVSGMLVSCIFCGHFWAPVDARSRDVFPDYGYDCDDSVQKCAEQHCNPKVYMAIPEYHICESWKCVLWCAKKTTEMSIRTVCLDPWVALCNQLARQPLPFGAGSSCDVDCSVAAPRAHIAGGFLLVALALALHASWVVP